jgi:hypothetical protein
VATGTRAAPGNRRLIAHPRWLAAAAAVAAVALAFVIQQRGEPPAQLANYAGRESAGAARAVDATAYEKGLKLHLASTEKQLGSLGEATPDERARLVETIIGQNRLYALAAERAGEPQLARVLRAFTPVLENVADGRAESAGSVAQLSFELRVMQARLNADGAASSIL